MSSDDRPSVPSGSRSGSSGSPTRSTGNAKSTMHETSVHPRDGVTGTGDSQVSLPIAKTIQRTVIAGARPDTDRRSRLARRLLTDGEPSGETTSSNGTWLQNINSAETCRQFALPT
jgi:hypothetical protein